MRFVLVMLASLVLLGATAEAGGFPPPEEDQIGGPTVSGSADDSGDETEGEIPIDLSAPKRIQAGKERFHSTCAEFCHGHEPTLFIGKYVEPHRAFRTIHDGGGGATPMPPWGDVFSEEEIWELVAYITFLGKQAPH